MKKSYMHVGDSMICKKSLFSYAMKIICLPFILLFFVVFFRRRLASTENTVHLCDTKTR